MQLEKPRVYLFPFYTWILSVGSQESWIIAELDHSRVGSQQILSHDASCLLFKQVTSLSITAVETEASCKKPATDLCLWYVQRWKRMEGQNLMEDP